jgi:hypothetical protein
MRDMHVGEVPDRELETVLRHCFPHCQSTGQHRSIDYCTDTEELALVVQYSKNGDIVAMKPGPALTTAALATVIGLIETELLRPPATYVSREVLFAALPVEGFFRFRDDWQILPVPDNAPKPSMLVGPHPFLLEARVLTSSVPFLRMQRQRRRLEDLQAVLSLLLHGGVAGRARSSHHRWVTVLREPDMQPETLLADEGYSYPGYVASGQEFGSTEGLTQLTTVPDEDYFSLIGISTEQRLELPACLGRVMELLEAADSAVRDPFMRACVWLDRALAVWPESISLSYIALVNAVETLTTGSPVVKCAHCGSTAPGPTRAFKDCLGTYAGGTDQAMRDRLYDLRSQLVHGTLLLDRDMPGLPGFDPDGLEQRDSWYAMHSIARIAVVNWFCEKANSH